MENRLQMHAALFRESVAVQDKVGLLLKIKNFLPSLELSDLEEKIFQPFISQVPLLFESVLNLSKNPSGSSLDFVKTSITYIQLACSVLEVLSSCVQAVGVAPVIPLESVSSLPANVLSVLAKVYKHCAESSSTYGCHLESLSDALGSLFKQNMILQKEIGLVLERLSLTSEVRHEIKILCSICSEVQHLCQLVSCKDVKIAHSLWKTYIRLLCRFSLCLKDEIDIVSVVLQLVEFCRQSITDLKLDFESPQNGDAFQSSSFDIKAKMVAFNLNFIIASSDKFDAEPCPKELFDLILEYYQLFVTCCETCKSSQVHFTLQKNLNPGIQALIKHLLNDRQFILFAEESSCDDYTSFQIPLCLLKTEVIIQLYNNRDVSSHIGLVNCQMNLFNSLLSILSSWQPEFDFSLRLISVLDVTKPGRMVSFHEYIATYIGAFAAKFCSCHFSLLETKLLQTLLCQNDYLALLVCDIWCLVVRYGPPEVCYAHVCALSRLMPHVKNMHSAMWITFLIGRLKNFLTNSQKAQLERSFPNTHSGILNEEITEVLNHPLNFFHLLEQETVCDISTAKNQLLAIESLMEKHKADSTIYQYLLKKLAGSILKLSLLLAANEEQMLQVILLAYSFWKCKNVAVQVAVLLFIKQFADKYISLSSEHPQIVSLFDSVFCEMLIHESALIRFEALCVFSELAYSKTHRVLIKFCAKKPHIKPIITAFFRKIPLCGNLSSQTIASTFVHHQCWSRDASVMPSDTTSDNMLSALVKAKYSEDEENSRSNKQLELCLSDLTSSVEKLEACQPLSPSVRSKVKTLIGRLNRVAQEGSFPSIDSY